MIISYGLWRAISVIANLYYPPPLFYNIWRSTVTYLWAMGQSKKGRVLSHYARINREFWSSNFA